VQRLALVELAGDAGALLRVGAVEVIERRLQRLGGVTTVTQLYATVSIGILLCTSP
jgi:hypothetical protein